MLTYKINMNRYCEFLLASSQNQIASEGRKPCVY
jgi:hypothetical protein